jgi:hypothetical protein
VTYTSGTSAATVRNNKTGKRYKINMTPMPELDEEMGKFSTGPRPDL